VSSRISVQGLLIVGEEFTLDLIIYL